MIGIFILTALAFVLSFVLVVVDARLNKVDGRLREIESLLPGYNCGSCGFSWCRAMSEEILKNKDIYIKCRPLRGKAKKEMEDYLGIEEVK
ncbi:MAG: (Fe-S)-binding protein [Bacilli bacterium]|nr:(Fe-S)-binding protein [Bacilli bacterium]